MVRQLVGVGMVPGYVMNGEGFSAVKTSICPHIPLLVSQCDQKYIIDVIAIIAIIVNFYM